jgi:hypothetical protein
MANNGVFTAFPDKVNRHWKAFGIAFVVISTFLYVVIPGNTDGDDSLFSVRNDCPSLATCVAVPCPAPSGGLSP